MKPAQWIAFVCMLGGLSGFTSCSEGSFARDQTPTPPATDSQDSENDETITSQIMKIQIGNAIFQVSLANNETAAAFRTLLPMTITMNELNGNEKYYNLSSELPTDAYRPGTIRAGDLLLYGSNCVVLFYETFSSPYSYTRIGRVDDPTGLAEAVGSGRVSVTFSLQE